MAIQLPPSPSFMSESHDESIVLANVPERKPSSFQECAELEFSSETEALETAKSLAEQLVFRNPHAQLHTEGRQWPVPVTIPSLYADGHLPRQSGTKEVAALSWD